MESTTESTQTGTITVSGLVVDANNLSPLNNVRYQESALKIEGTTDEKGYFTIKIPNANYPFKINLVFIKEAYENWDSKVEVGSPKNGTDRNFVQFVGMSPGNEYPGFIHGMSLPEKNNKESNYELVLKSFEEMKQGRNEHNTLMERSVGSDKPYWVINGHTYVLTSGGSTASVDTITDIVMVDGKRMTGKEVNEKFTRSMIRTIAAVTKEAALTKYGINQDVMEIYINTRASNDSIQKR
jgi:hypothetical protein